MGQISLIEIRNFVWQAKIKSVWHNGVQAPLRFFFLPKNPLLSHFTNKKLFQWHLVCHAVLSITLVFRHCLRSVKVLNCCSDHKKFQKSISIFDKNQKSNAKSHKICKPKWRKLKNQSFLTQKTKKTNLKLAKTAKPKIPNALLLIEEWYVPLASLCPWQHDTTLLNTAVKVTTWSFGKNSQMDLHSTVSPRLYFGILCNISNFHWNIFIF